MKEYNSESLSKSLTPLFQKLRVRLAYFFGSAYERKTGPLSDIDLAVLWGMDETLPMLKSLELQRAVQEFLGENSFEIGCLNGQNLSFCYNVISRGKCIFGSESERVIYETEILSQYLDFSALGDQYNRTFDQRLMRSGKNG